MNKLILNEGRIWSRDAKCIEYMIATDILIEKGINSYLFILDIDNYLYIIANSRKAYTKSTPEWGKYRIFLG